MTKRVISALIGIPIFLFIVGAGSRVYIAAVTIVLAIACSEFFAMSKVHGNKPYEMLGYVYLAATIITTVESNTVATISENLAFFFATICMIVLVFSFPKRSFADAGITVLGVVYIAGTGKYFLLLRTLGVQAVYICFLVAWSYDTFAYFSGLTLGRRRPWPELSPKKSLEGVIGGMIGSATVAFFFALWWSWPVVPTILFALGASFLGQIGDLIESSIKRFFGVKDSGTILPGHGGILDRFDGALLIAPVAYYFVSTVIF